MGKTKEKAMKEITGFEGYCVTESGEVMNLKTKRTLKFDVNNCGYRRVTLSKDGKTKRFFVHRLVALHYLPNPAGSEVVNHKDGDKLNNNVDNLEWCSSSRNRLHAFEVGLCGKGEAHHNSRVSNMHVEQVCKLIQDGLTRGEVLALVPQVSKYTFDDIRRRKTWTHISKDFNW